jgi:predicted oxidoreductase
MRVTQQLGSSQYPRNGAIKTWNEYVQGDWRNCRPDAIKAVYDDNFAIKVALTYLKETVARWNSFVAKGADPDFERGPDAPMHAIATPPFYAARIIIEWHDSCGGLRINGKAQVLDMKGQVIPGLYAGGEATGAHLMHGLGKCCTHGYMAASNAVDERA